MLMALYSRTDGLFVRWTTVVLLFWFCQTYLLAKDPFPFLKHDKHRVRISPPGLDILVAINVCQTKLIRNRVTKKLIVFELADSIPFYFRKTEKKITFLIILFHCFMNILFSWHCIISALWRLSVLSLAHINHIYWNPIPPKSKAGIIGVHLSIGACDCEDI